MITLNTLKTAVANRLTTGFAALAAQPALVSLTEISVLVQDANDLENKIDIAVDKIGLLCLVNMPSFSNEAPLSQQINSRIKFVVEIGEDPIVWRDEPLTRPVGLDVAQIAAELLQDFPVAGFQNLRVLAGDFQRDKKRQVYFLNIETMQIFSAT